jgi:glyceraldehyde 3-phosphate dehydrogenase
MDKINEAMIKSAKLDLKGVLGIITDPIVSIDIVGSPLSSAYDAGLSRSFGKVLKIIAWYDNEAGYSNRLLELTKKVHENK